MKIEKIKLEDMTRCYAVGILDNSHSTRVIFASEDPGHTCYSYNVKDFNDKELVWDGSGGTMSIVQIPNHCDGFLAVQEFYLSVSPSLSKIVYCHKINDKWQIDDLLYLPYVHRFDIISKNRVNYLICATVAETKDYKEDWTKPGSIYVGAIPKNLSEGINLKCIKDGCYRNHGYWRGNNHGEQCGFFASDQGVLCITPPSIIEGNWNIEKVLDGQISEIALVDIDNDGDDEMITIEPFHGDRIKIYKKRLGVFNEVYVYPYKINFAHALVGAKICGKNSFIGGVRRENSELFIIQYHDGKYIEKIIDTGVGPANIRVINQDGYDLIISANHTKNEAAVYIVTED